MISIIICSRHSDISQTLKENIKNTIGVEHEIVVIDNSNNDYSIYSAYNKGFDQSKYPNLCFVHEDIMFKTENWGTNLLNHLEDKKTGIVGVAGGQIMTRVPSSWAAGGRYMNIIQHYRSKKKKSYLREPETASIRESVILLDGVFLSMRRELFGTIKFDETLKGFHGYDFDISVQSITAGYINYAVYDILFEHFSAGNRTAEYYHNLNIIYKKWQSYLPLSCNRDFDEIKEIEIIYLAKLIRRLARMGLKSNEVIDTANYYVDIINSKEAKDTLKFIRLKIIFERIVNPNKM